MSGTARKGGKSIGVALCISAAVHLALLSAATILLRVPQTREQEIPGTLTITGTAEVLDKGTAAAPRPAC